VLAVIRRLTREGMTMMIVTHELDFASEVSNRIFYMDEGGIYESGTPDQIMRAPERPKTRVFINRLRSFCYRIGGPAVDTFAMNAEIESFCEKHYFSRRMTQHTLLAVEESLALYFAQAESSVVSLMLTYGENDGTLQIRFDDQRQPCHFLDESAAGDGLSLTLLKGIVHDIAWERTEGGNRVSMVLNETRPS